jgi:hypothetical protein
MGLSIFIVVITVGLIIVTSIVVRKDNKKLSIH